MEHLDFDTGGSDAFGLLLNETIRKFQPARFVASYSVYQKGHLLIYEALNI